jgi:maltose alpha-D-glucosyltransferase/alpha-amylase
MLGSLPEQARVHAEALLAAEATLLARIDALSALSASGLKTRLHGDFHLGQVLVAQDDVMIVDFEGEPERDVAERREKTSALVDVAGMIRSFDYAAWAALDRLGARQGTVDARVRARALAWRDRATADFLAAYWQAAAGGFLPAEPETRSSLLDLFKIRKAAYEIGYETANRPAWVPIPVRGLLDLLAEPAETA